MAAEIRYPGRRGDVVEALALFVALTPENVAHRPGDLDDAVHWLVDDTFWDLHDVADSIGFLLRDKREVAVIEAVLDPLLAVLGALGPVRPDVEYFCHERWPDVVAAAANAHRLLDDA
ncbi:hypothetical protein GCM10022243_09260 [Saccharothrix violaceirubra]|uniref:Uncharacterized protein n=1 Tax=Saccharothrix violaceirubra TaxID=413306 RepID=A0A7W7T594_9PSEU|nr:hypothetical protein [Saccharothrix violaceirubra]MBB4966237.1 hypothetical protein [Saccharothrix violaceirubra]